MAVGVGVFVGVEHSGEHSVGPGFIITGCVGVHVGCSVAVGVGVWVGVLVGVSVGVAVGVGSRVGVWMG